MDNLQTVWDYCQKKLEIRKGAWRSAVLATCGEDGPEARTVIVRDYKWPHLVFYSDSRTPKIRDLKTDPRVSVVFYDPKKRVQIRLKGRAEFFTSGPEVKKALAELPERSSFDYRTKLPPGNETQSDTAARNFSETRNFALVRIELSELDCLLLRAEGHSRAKFTGPEAASWIVP